MARAAREHPPVFVAGQTDGLSTGTLHKSLLLTTLAEALPPWLCCHIYCAASQQTVLRSKNVLTKHELSAPRYLGVRSFARI